MQSSLRPGLIKLRRFRNTLCGKLWPLEAVRVSVKALRTLNDLSKEGVMAMVKVGDKLVVSVKVTQIIEDKNGIRYMVEPLSNIDGFQTMQVSTDDIKSIIE